MLQHSGLAVALEHHCGEFAKRHAIGVVVRAEFELGVIDAAMALCLYRISQEALSNIAKHAGARTPEHRDRARPGSEGIGSALC